MYICSIITTIFVYRFYFLKKGFIDIFTITDVEHRNDRPLGIVNIIVGILVSKLFSFFVQLLLMIKCCYNHQS